MVDFRWVQEQAFQFKFGHYRAEAGNPGEPYLRAPTNSAAMDSRLASGNRARRFDDGRFDDGRFDDGRFGDGRF